MLHLVSATFVEIQLLDAMLCVAASGAGVLLSIRLSDVPLCLAMEALSINGRMRSKIAF